jgi:hypothetical protein
MLYPGGLASDTYDGGADTVGEMVEIVEGVGSTRYPMWGVVDIVWSSNVVSGLTFEAGSKEILSDSTEYGLIFITYNRKYYKYDVEGQGGAFAQLLMQDTSAA